MTMDYFGTLSVQIAQEFSQAPDGHAAAPEGIGNFVIVAISGLVVALVLFLCIKYFLLPKEKEDTHIKKRILDDEVHDGREMRREREP